MTVPNMLSLLRLILVPVFAVVFLSDIPNASLWGVLIYAVASATDFLDGYIARKYNQITKLGRFLDPLADKLMGGTMLLCICIKQIVPWWALAVFVLKEMTMAIGGVVCYKKTTDVFPSRILGKVATFVFIIVCLILIIFENISYTIATILISFALVLSVAAMVDYAITYGKKIFNKE